MLTTNEIKKQMQNGNIEILNCSEKAFRKPNSVDIRMGNVLYTFDYGVVDSRNGSLYLQEVLNDRPNLLKTIIIPETGLLLEPDKVYLTKTVEKVATHGYIPVMHGKVSFSLLGVSTELNSGYKYDEYNSYLPLSIVATKPTIIYPDMVIGNLTFFKGLDEPLSIRQINENTSCGIYEYGMLSGEEIKRRMNLDKPDIIIKEPDNIVINPNSVNLTLNSTVGVYTEPILDLKKDNPIKKTEIPEEGMWFYPGEVYLCQTNEWTETYNLVPMMSGRSSLGRNGFYVHCSAGKGDIGYQGYWHLGIRTVKPIWVVKDMKCCQIYYFTPEGEIDKSYNGSMQALGKDELGSQLYRSLRK